MTSDAIGFEPGDQQRDAGLSVLVTSVASAPLTFAWLLVLLVTTRIQRSAGRQGSRRIQRTHSTNLRRLRTEPSRVLTTSLFWLDDRKWWPYVPAFIGVVAPAERRLRWWRWLLVGIAAHVIATYAGQIYLRQSIRTGRAPRRFVNARDVGVSYFFLGAAGTLARRIRSAAGNGLMRLPVQVGFPVSKFLRHPLVERDTLLSGLQNEARV